MPLRSTPCSDPYCEGIVLEIGDEDKLAHSVALILAQQYSAATQIALGQLPTTGKLMINPDAIVEQRLGTKDKKGKESEKVRFHRDGLLFQLIAWLSSQIDVTASDYVVRPHLFKAGKGIDGCIVHLGTNTDIAGISICEDKATDNPRNLMTSAIWPEFDACERGEKDDELRTFVIDALVRRNIDEELAEQTAGAILWHNCRRYRVRTTVGDTHSAPPERGNLFKDFEVHVKGNIGRRRGETLHLANLRDWMNAFAAKVETELRSLR